MAVPKKASVLEETEKIGQYECQHHCQYVHKCRPKLHRVCPNCNHYNGKEVELRKLNLFSYTEIHNRRHVAVLLTQIVHVIERAAV